MAAMRPVRRRGTMLLCIAAAALCVAACNSQPSGTAAPGNGAETGKAASAGFVWPAAFRVMGDGYPKAGDPCRRLGESPATADYLDDSAILVGCPGAAADTAAAAVVAAGGRVVGAAEGVTLISMPQGDANAGMRQANSQQ
jgi:hypothetical protein